MYCTSSLGSIVIVVLAIVMVSHVTWARCICDPADTLCLDGCVNSTRDCIEACNDDSSVDCFTGCINSHWPGTTFEDASSNDDLSSSVVVSSVSGTTTTNEVVIPIGGVEYATTTTSPFLLSVFAGGKSTATIPAVPLTNIDGDSPSDNNSLINDAITAASSPASTFLNTMSPTSFETTHTTITSLLTITPNATSSSSSFFTNNYNTSHGLKNLVFVDTWSLIITGFLLLLITYHLV